MSGGEGVGVGVGVGRGGVGGGPNECTVNVYPDALRDAMPSAGDPRGDDMIGSIDQGTSSTKFLIFTRGGKVAASAQMEHAQIYPDGEDRVSFCCFCFCFCFFERVCVLFLFERRRLES